MCALLAGRPLGSRLAPRSAVLRRAPLVGRGGGRPRVGPRAGPCGPSLVAACAPSPSPRAGSSPRAPLSFGGARFCGAAPSPLRASPCPVLRGPFAPALLAAGAWALCGPLGRGGRPSSPRLSPLGAWGSLPTASAFASAGGRVPRPPFGGLTPKPPPLVREIRSVNGRGPAPCTPIILYSVFHMLYWVVSALPRPR